MRVWRERAPKIEWSGLVLGVQPRIRLLRSFNERSHEYFGYVLWLKGHVGGVEREFSVAIGHGTQGKHGFLAGGCASGLAETVPNPDLEVAELYKASSLTFEPGPPDPTAPPPWRVPPPPLEVYRERGHRRLATETYHRHCQSCTWGCLMPVEMIIDHWKPDVRRYRRETFCYGPKSCPLYRAGPTRKVPGRRGMTYEEENWVDAEETGHRGRDE